MRNYVPNSLRDTLLAQSRLKGHMTSPPLTYSSENQTLMPAGGAGVCRMTEERNIVIIDLTVHTTTFKKRVRDHFNRTTCHSVTVCTV